MQKTINHYGSYIVLMILSLVLESIIEFDEFFQQLFLKNGRWIISPEFHAQYKWFFYTGIKVCIIIFTIGLFLCLLFFIYSKNKSYKKWIKPLLYVIICIIVIPLTVSFLKAKLGVYGPKNLLLYGGEKEHIGFLMQIWKYGHVAGGRCFHAGHASGGFALMSLCLFPVSNRNRKLLLLVGFTLGWLMGLYQMARGEHFITHTLFTMFLSLFVISLLKKVDCQSSLDA